MYQQMKTLQQLNNKYMKPLNLLPLHEVRESFSLIFVIIEASPRYLIVTFSIWV